MDLYFLRHGDAEPKGLGKVSTDEERSLSATGREGIANRAEWFLERGIRFERILFSPLRRARETAEIVSEKLRMGGCAEEVSFLKPGIDSVEFFRELSRYGSFSSLLLVGHQPDLGRHIDYGMFGEVRQGVHLDTGGICRLVLEGFPPKSLGEIRWLIND